MSNAEPLEHFKQLFWTARKLSRAKKDVPTAVQAFQAAEAWARSHGLPAEADLARAGYLECEQKYGEAENAAKAAAQDTRLRCPGLGWFLLGSINHAQKRLDTTPAIIQFTGAGRVQRAA
jgi:hypothetical protein